MASDKSHLDAGDGAPGGDASSSANRWAEAWDVDPESEELLRWRRIRAGLDATLDGELPDSEDVDASLHSEVEDLRHWATADSWLFGRSAAWLDDPDPEDARLGGCERIRLIGRGGMGEVYEALDLTLGPGLERRVALKVLNSTGVEDDLVVSLERDIAALVRLEHPGIARLYRAGVDAGRAFVVTEFVSGEPMLAFVDRCSASHPDRRATLAIELGELLADAIAAAHAAGVVHRDLKSANVLVREDGRLSVVDFGIASLEGGARADSDSAVEILSHRADPRGSLGAISPERARGVHSGPREDVWAIGALLFETATGRPVRSRSSEAWMRDVASELDSIGREAAPAVRSVSRSISGDLAAVIDRCLAFDPGDRYPNAAEVRDDLTRVRTGRAPLARNVGRWGDFVRLIRRRPLMTGLIVLAMASLLIGTAVATVMAVKARRAEGLAEARSALLLGVADDLMVDVAESLRDVPGATEARRRLLELGLGYAEAVAIDGPAEAGDELLVDLARTLFTLGQLHREMQPNAAEDQLGREAFERAASLARRAAGASGETGDPACLGLAARAEAIAIHGRPGTTEAERVEAWKAVIELTDRALRIDPGQIDALLGRSWAAMSIGDIRRRAGDFDEAMGFFTESVSASTRAVEIAPDRAETWFHHGSALNSLWWILYTERRAGNEARILDIVDRMADAERREEDLLAHSSARSSRLITDMSRMMLAIEFRVADPVEAEEVFEDREAAIVALSEAEPELGILRRRRAEAHLRHGQGLSMLVEQAVEAGRSEEAVRLAARAAVAFEACARVQRDRLGRREQVATNEDAMLTFAVEQAEAMRRVAARGGTASGE